jgi:outer membrane protein
MDDDTGNSFDQGIVTPENRYSWTAGVAMALPIFNGFHATAEVKEARARLERLRRQEILLREGIALQVKDVFPQPLRSQEERQAMESAARTAEENRDLKRTGHRTYTVE